MKLRTENLGWGINGKKIIDNLDLHIREGDCIGIVGPNGSGKSSLLRCIYRVNKPSSGTILLDEENIMRLSTREMAKRAASVLQESTDQFEFRVREVVMMGRNPHKGLLDRDTEQDKSLVSEALSRVGLADFADRFYSTLSGGEKQRTLIARALAQQAEFLMLDEPTNHLDIHYQLEIMELIRTLDVTSLVVMHDLNLAAQYCNGVYVMNGGKIHTFGPPEEVLTAEMIRKVYRVNASVNRQPETGKLNISFYHFQSKGICSTSK